MTPKLWLDLETYSEVPITNGTHVYAAGAEIMLFAWALDDAPVQVWDCTRRHNIPAELDAALQDPAVEIWAHNSHFDRTVFRATFEAYRDEWTPSYPGTPERWRDTMVQALAHSLPGGLGQLCEILKVPTDQAKDKEGRQLVHLFCKPRPATSKIRRATRETHPAEWAKFVEYARLDVEAMRECHRRLPVWNYGGKPGSAGDRELALWHLDQQINDRGVAVDMPLVHAAIAAVEQEQARLAARTAEMTDGQVESATKRDALLAHILEAYGVDLPDLQGATLERRVNDPDLPAELRELLTIRLAASSTSTSKYKTLLRATSSDGRLRGTLQFDGAGRTGRWAGRLFQPQNLPRPTLTQDRIELGIDAMLAGAADLVAEDVMALASSAVRGALIAPPERKLVVADLSNIEGRALAWLAGEEWKLQAFSEFDVCKGQDGAWHSGPAVAQAELSGRPIALALDKKGEPIHKGSDLYALSYAQSFRVTPEEVMDNKKNGDGRMRQIGKVQELMLGYEGGVGAFLTGAATYGFDVEELGEVAFASLPAWAVDEAGEFYDWTVRQKRSTFGLSRRAFVTCDAIKRMWRAAHPAIASFWGHLKETVILAIEQPGATRVCRLVKVRRDGNWLRIGLPSGRALCYPSPQVEDGVISYMGVNQYTRKWSRLKTYGGKLAENITQAVARDVMAANMPAIEAAGFEIVLTVHDEAITEAPDVNEFTAQRLAALLATVPAWAQGLPLAAAGFETHRYRKD